MRERERERELKKKKELPKKNFKYYFNRFKYYYFEKVQTLIAIICT